MLAFDAGETILSLICPFRCAFLLAWSACSLRVLSVRLLSAGIRSFSLVLFSPSALSDLCCFAQSEMLPRSIARLRSTVMDIIALLSVFTICAQLAEVRTWWLLLVRCDGTHLSFCCVQAGKCWTGIDCNQYAVSTITANGVQYCCYLNGGFPSITQINSVTTCNCGNADEEGLFCSKCTLHCIQSTTATAISHHSRLPGCAQVVLCSYPNHGANTNGYCCPKGMAASYPRRPQCPGNAAQYTCGVTNPGDCDLACKGRTLLVFVPV